MKNKWNDAKACYKCGSRAVANNKCCNCGQSPWDIRKVKKS